MTEKSEDEFESPLPNTENEEAQAVNPLALDTEQEEAASDPLAVEVVLPPEAQGEVNGGPLGCCLGVMVGLLLSLSLAILSRLYADPLSQFFQHKYWLLGLSVRLLMGLLAFTLAIVCGVFGWKLGKRFYREYH
jgi:hypothetical protein